jgi:hypothetical protein
VIKYTCYCLTSVEASDRSTEITVLTTASLAATYSSRISLGHGGTRVGRNFRYCLSSTNATAA